MMQIHKARFCMMILILSKGGGEAIQAYTAMCEQIVAP